MVRCRRDRFVTLANLPLVNIQNSGPVSVDYTSRDEAVSAQLLLYVSLLPALADFSPTGDHRDRNKSTQVSRRDKEGREIRGGGERKGH